MNIQVFPSGPLETNAYIIASSLTKEAAIIDPAPESAKKIISYLTANQLSPVIILLTHSHWDHIADTSVLKKQYQIPVAIQQLDAGNLEQPGSDGLPCWLVIEGVKPDRYLAEGDDIVIGDLRFEVIHTPGHTPGGICFYCKEQHLLVSGDTLFKGSIGNISFATARPNLMWKSLAKLAKLPPDTRVYPGHGPSTTIGAESWLPNAEQVFGDYL